MISRGLLFYADFTAPRKKGGKVPVFEKPWRIELTQEKVSILKNSGVFGQLALVQID